MLLLTMSYNSQVICCLCIYYAIKSTQTVFLIIIMCYFVIPVFKCPSFGSKHKTLLTQSWINPGPHTAAQTVYGVGNIGAMSFKCKPMLAERGVRSRTDHCLLTTLSNKLSEISMKY